MKTLKAICTAAMLASVLTIPAYAGDIETPGIKAPTPVQTSKAGTSSTAQSTTPGDIETPGLADIVWLLVSMF